MKKNSPNAMQCSARTVTTVGDCNTEQRFDAIYKASLFCDEAGTDARAALRGATATQNSAVVVRS